MSELLDVIKPLLPLLALCSILVFIISLASLPWLVAKIPEDYFLHRKRKKTLPLTTGAFVRYLSLRLARNLCGTNITRRGFSDVIYPRTGSPYHGDGTYFNGLSWEVFCGKGNHRLPRPV